MSNAYSRSSKSTIDLKIISVTKVGRKALMPITPIKKPLRAPHKIPEIITITRVEIKH